MTKPIDIAATIKMIEHHEAEIAKHRDALRKIQSELEGTIDSFERGLSSLREAVDAFSEHV